MTELLKVCPCCGTDIALDQPILMNDFTMIGSNFPLHYKGQRVPLVAVGATICYALMKAYPGYLTAAALAERIGTESDNPDGIVRVYICRIRKVFRELGMPMAIETVKQHHAYVWDPR